MIFMMLIMSFPVLGLILFYVLPLGTALPLYLLMLGVSLPLHCLMMRAMRLPKRAGGESMVGSAAGVLDWEGESGRVICRGEIWKAKATGETPLVRGDKVVIEDVAGLTLSVKRIGQVGSDEMMTLLDSNPGVQASQGAQTRSAREERIEPARPRFECTA